MASYTTNLSLKKPAGSENVAIGDINNNMDTIDSAYGTLSNQKAKVVYEDIAITNAHGVGISAATSYRCSNTKFLSAIVIGTNYITVVPYTYSNLVYCTLKNIDDMSNAADANYTVRVFYTNEAQEYNT